jgi:hypothetical protein
MRTKCGLVLSVCCAIAPVGAYGQDIASKRVSAAFATPAVVTIARDAGKSVMAGECPPTDLQHVQALVREIATEEGFDGDLAEAIAWAESSMGQNQGPSNAGALGIMQLMPATASKLGVADRCDAETNVRAGIRYLKMLYDEFHDPLLMLAAYNAGEQNVYAANGIPVNEETAKYIIKILNRWKFGNVVRSTSSIHSEAQALAADDEPDDGAWQDGHVIDFGN